MSRSAWHDLSHPPTVQQQCLDCHSTFPRPTRTCQQIQYMVRCHKGRPMNLHDIMDRLSTFARLEIVDETIVTDITALCLEDNTYPVSWFAACSSCSLCTYGTTSEKVKYS